jgi:hypothetical protein
MATVAGITLIAGDEPSGFVPRDGFVPNAEVAVKIAEAVLIPVFGKQQVLSERPFKARLEGELWIVEGTLNCAGICDGGTAEVRISKKSGEIIRMIHGK